MVMQTAMAPLTNNMDTVWFILCQPAQPNMCEMRSAVRCCQCLQLYLARHRLVIIINSGSSAVVSRLLLLWSLAGL